MFASNSSRSGFELNSACQNICIVCSKKAAILISVYQSKNNQIVVDLIRNVISKISIEKRVGKDSKQICSECLDIIINANDLRVKSILSEERLNSKETSLDNDNLRCRICLAETNDLHKIFNFRRGRTTIDAISAICPVSVKSSDPFSHQICFECLKTIDAACELRDLFEDQKFSLKGAQTAVGVEPISVSGVNFVDMRAVKPSNNKPVVLPVIDLDNDCIITNVSKVNVPKPIAFVSKMARNSKIVSKIPRKREPQVVKRIAQTEVKRLPFKLVPVKRDCCHLCMIKFASAAALEVHNKSKHKRDDKPFICRFKDCNRSFKDAATFRAHVTESHIRKTNGLNVNLVKKPTTVQRIVPATKLTTEFFSREKTIFKNLGILGSSTVSIKRYVWSCKCCVMKFPNQTSLDEHVVKEHRVRLTCSICHEIHQTNEEMEKHLRLHKDSLTYNCDHCSLITASKVQLQNHIETKHFNKGVPTKSFKCSQCNIVFKEKAAAMEHMLKHGAYQTIQVCDVCGFKATRQDTYIAHMRTHSDSNSVMCASCGLSFHSEEELELHEYSHSDIIMKLSDDDAMVSCAVCSFKSSSEAGVVRHLEEHQVKIETSSINCIRCREVIKDFDHLLLHQKTHMTRKNYKCLTCEKDFTYNDSFLRHIRQHVTNRCSYCRVDKTFKTKEELSEHIKESHVRNRTNHLCPKCGASYSSASKMRVHMERHSGEPTFACSVGGCSKKFYTKPHLRKHLPTHDVPSIPCTYCEKVFKSRHAQRRHELSFHVETDRIPCSFCDKTFKRKDHLRQHERTHKKNSE